MDNATRFFHACESLEGYDGCRPFIARDARFESQCEPLHDIQTVEQYVAWMQRLGRVTMQGCSYELTASAYDATHRRAMFFATFSGTHVGTGGPVPPTGKSTRSQYVYVLTMNGDQRVAHMVKIWNAPWAMREIGWL